MNHEKKKKQTDDKMTIITTIRTSIIMKLNSKNKATKEEANDNKKEEPWPRQPAEGLRLRAHGRAARPQTGESQGLLEIFLG